MPPTLNKAMNVNIDIDIDNNNNIDSRENNNFINYSLIDTCDNCHDYFPIHNYNDGKNYLIFIGSKLYCQKCIKK